MGVLLIFRTERKVWKKKKSCFSSFCQQILNADQRIISKKYKGGSGILKRKKGRTKENDARDECVIFIDLMNRIFQRFSWIKDVE